MNKIIKILRAINNLWEWEPSTIFHTTSTRGYWLFDKYHVTIDINTTKLGKALDNYPPILVTLFLLIYYIPVGSVWVVTYLLWNIIRFLFFPAKWFKGE